MNDNDDIYDEGDASLGVPIGNREIKITNKYPVLRKLIREIDPEGFIKDYRNGSIVLIIRDFSKGNFISTDFINKPKFKEALFKYNLKVTQACHINTIYLETIEI